MWPLWFIVTIICVTGLVAIPLIIWGIGLMGQLDDLWDDDQPGGEH